VNLDGAVLEDAVITCSVFDGAFLKSAGSKWTMDAVLTGADFTGANLLGAKAESALLDGAVFDHAQLEGAVFMGATISGTSFVGATGVEKVDFIGAKGAPARLRLG